MEGHKTRITYINKLSLDLYGKHHQVSHLIYGISRGRYCLDIYEPVKYQEKIITSIIHQVLMRQHRIKAI